MTALYTDRLSVRPGESFAIHASAARGPCRLEVARVGADRRVVLGFDLAVGDHPVPPGADANGCAWPETASIGVGDDWTSGYYDLLLVDQAGEAPHHFVCVKPSRGGSGAKAAIVSATNTYHAYNHFGGASAYCNVAALMRREADLATAMQGAIGVLRPSDLSRRC